MSKALLREVMRRTRKYTHDVVNNLHSEDREREEINRLRKADEMTQTVFDRRLTALNERIEKRRVELKKNVVSDLQKLLDEMREVSNRVIVRPVTQEIATTLQILGTLDIDTLTPVELDLYAREMANAPLAMKRLQQIAANHHLKIRIDDPEERLRAVDVLEGQLAYFLENYNGVPEKCPFIVHQMLQYLQDDTAYMEGSKTLTDTDKVNRAFWDKFVVLSSPEIFDNPEGEPEPPKTQYYFSDVDSMRAFFDRATAGYTDDKLKEDVVNLILKDCPEQYGAAYRCFKASGEKINLNDLPSVPNEE